MGVGLTNEEILPNKAKNGIFIILLGNEEADDVLELAIRSVGRSATNQVYLETSMLSNDVFSKGYFIPSTFLIYLSRYHEVQFSVFSSVLSARV